MRGYVLHSSGVSYKCCLCASFVKVCILYYLYSFICNAYILTDGISAARQYYYYNLPLCSIVLIKRCC